jgi:uncharacterized repeat protein (TIGR03803 family)
MDWNKHLLTSPTGTLALYTDGYIYGVTRYGGASGVGTVFELAPRTTRGSVWTETILHSFTGKDGDAGLPNGVVIGQDGALYATTMETTSPSQCQPV